MENFIITNKGKELQARMVAGDTTAKFIHISTSAHDYSGENLEKLTELADIKQTALVSSVVRKETTLVSVIASVENSSLTDGYYVKALGLYAEDDEGNEVLFAVSTSSDYPDYMPPFSGSAVSSVTYEMNIKVDTAEHIVIEVNPAAAPTVKEVEEIADAKTSNHAGNKVCSEKGIHGLRYQDGKFNVQDVDGNWEEIPGSGQITDAVTGDIYTIGISNGVLTITGAGESEADQNTNQIETSSAITGVLSAGETELTLSDECITAESTIDIYTDCYGVNPKTVTAEDGSITMTFKAQAEDIKVKVVVK